MDVAPRVIKVEENNAGIVKPTLVPPSNSASDGALSPIQPLPAKRLFLLSLPTLSPQVGWTVAEVFIVTYLLRLGASAVVANSVWLMNPVLAIVLQPVIGGLSEGRRFFFVLLFHALALIGMLIVLYAEVIFDYFSDPADVAYRMEHKTDASPWLIAIIFAGVALSDLSFDTMLIPARALLHENVPPSQLAEASVYFSNMSIIGAVIGLLITLVDLEKMFPFNIFDTHMQATYLAVCLMTASAIGFLYIYLPRKGVHTAAHDDDDEHAEVDLKMLRDIVVTFRSIPKHVRYIWLVTSVWWWTVLASTFWWTAWINYEVLNLPMDATDLRFEGTELVPVSTLEDVVVAASDSSSLPSLLEDDDELYDVAIKISVLCGLIFYASTWLFSGLTAYFNERWGVLFTFHIASMIYAVTIMLSYVWRTVGGALFVYAASGFVYTVHTTNCFLIIEKYIADTEKQMKLIADAEDQKNKSAPKMKIRGVLIAFINLTMTVGQIIVATTSGFIIDIFEDVTQVFVLPAVILFLLSGITMYFKLTSRKAAVGKV